MRARAVVLALLVLSALQGCSRKSSLFLDPGRDPDRQVIPAAAQRGHQTAPTAQSDPTAARRGG